jgi:hypothetical protein
LSQEAEVGVRLRWKAQRGWRASQASTLGACGWHSCRGRRGSACQLRPGARQH